MANIINLSATTELQAVNALLSAIGEQPVASVNTARADVERAVNLLRDKTRTLLNDRWKFNTEFGLAITATSVNQAWTDPDGTVKTLYVFKPPTGLARWELSRNAEQSAFDVAVRPSKVYVESLLPVLVFYDRKNNRDGFEASTLKSNKLWIDATWYFNFEQLPDTARRFVVASAMLDYIVDMIGAESRAAFKASSEQIAAFRALKDDQGDEDDYNLLNSPDIAGILGGRFRDRGIGIDPRSNP